MTYQDLFSFKNHRSKVLACILGLMMFVTTRTNAQTFSVEVDTASMFTLVEEFAILNIYIYNESGADLNLAWVKLEDNYPAEWERSLCDYDLCYFDVPDSGTMQTLTGNRDAFLKLTIYAEDVVSPLVTSFQVYDVDNPQYKDTVTFVYTVALVSTPEFEMNSIAVYPNPAGSELHLSGITADAEVKIFDNMGRVVALSESQSTNDRIIDVAELSNGVYSVRIKTAEHVVTKTFVKD